MLIQPTQMVAKNLAVFQQRSLFNRRRLRRKASSAPPSVVPVREEMLERAKEEAAQPTFVGSRTAERVLLEQMREECLREILRVGWSMTTPAQKRTQRWPIGLAKTR